MEQNWKYFNWFLLLKGETCCVKSPGMNEINIQFKASDFHGNSPTVAYLIN